MIHHHKNQEKKLASRILSVCLALILLCSIALPAYAEAVETGAESDTGQVFVSEPAGPSVDRLSVDEEKQPEEPSEPDSQTKKEDLPEKAGDAKSKENAQYNEQTTKEEKSEPEKEVMSQDHKIPEKEIQDDKESTEEALNKITSDDQLETAEEKEAIEEKETIEAKETIEEKETTEAKETTEEKETETLQIEEDKTETIPEDQTETEQESMEETDIQSLEAATMAVPLADSDTIKVYVYVAGYDFSEECLELLGIDPGTLDGNGYFPAGEIELDSSFLDGKKNANRAGAPLINSTSDWKAVLAALNNMNTQTLVDDSYNVYTEYSKNRGNYVGKYLNQAAGDVGYSWGSQHTALFYWNWNSNHSYGFKDQTVRYHLDLRFETNKITFITGNNGISSGNAKDGTTVDARTYITGSIIQEPRNLTIPAGYRFVGYYTDAEFTTPWNGIGTPLNSDQTVYIKITPKDNVVIRYVNVSGDEAGTLTRDSEGLNPDTGVANGSLAAAKDGYVFAGWYTDEDCTELITNEGNFVPQKPDGGWVDGTTFYAKFSRKTCDITVKKMVAGGLGDRSREFDFSYSYTDPENDQTVTGNFKLKHEGTTTISDVPVGVSLTVTERNLDYRVSAKYGSNAVSISYTDKEDKTKSSASLNVAVNEDDTQITVTNLKDVSPDTGVILDSRPYAAVLVLLLAAMAVLLSCRCRHKA